MEYGLIENALHSLSEAAQYYNDTDEETQPDKYKFSILLAAHCAELLLKEILRRVHPAFIYADVDKYSPEETDRETIGYRMSIRRVKSVAGVDLGVYENHLIELGTVRNRLQHFKYEINGEFQKQLMCRSFSAIEFLLNEVLKEDIENYSGIISTDEIGFLKEDEDRIKIRLKDINKEFSEGVYQRAQIEYRSGKYFDVLCPACGNKALAQIGDSFECKMCNETFASIEEVYAADQNCTTRNYFLREIGRRRKNGVIKSFECPRCNYDAIIYLPNHKWKCLACGKEYEGSVSCDDCGDEMPNSDSFYYVAMSDTDTSDYKLLCPECARTAIQSPEYIGYEISRS